MSSVFEQKEASLQRAPVYFADFGLHGSPLATVKFGSHRVRVQVDYVDETDTVDEFFTIDENKTYNDEFFTFPRQDHSVLGDLFPWINLWQLGTSLAYMQIPSTLAPMQVYPEQGHCSVGVVELTIEDRGEAVTALMADIVIGRRVRVYGGFHDIDEDDYQRVYTGTIQSVRMTSDLSSYKIRLHNTQARVNRRLFQGGHGNLFFDITIDDDEMAVSLGGAALMADTGYALVDSEVIGFQRAGLALFDITRGEFGSIVTAHAADAPIQEIFPIGPLHPIDIMLQRYYGTPSKTCLGLEYDDIDWLSFARARDVIGPALMQFYVTQEENILEWVAREICLPMGMFVYVTADNKLAVKAFEAAAAPTVTFDGTNIREENGKPLMTWGLAESNLGLPINDVTINYDLSPVTGIFHSFFNETRPTSISNHGQSTVVINSAGLRFSLAGTATLVANRTAAILDRFENGTTAFTIRTHMNKRAAEVGSIAGITSPWIPNRQTGTKGVTNARAEIINRSMQWDEGDIEFTLLGADAQL